jgi:hypothetical protein
MGRRGGSYVDRGYSYGGNGLIHSSNPNVLGRRNILTINSNYIFYPSLQNMVSLSMKSVKAKLEKK